MCGWLIIRQVSSITGEDFLTEVSKFPISFDVIIIINIRITFLTLNNDHL